MAVANDVDVVIGIDAARVRAGMQQARQAVTNAVGGIQTEFRRVGVAANDAGMAVQRSVSRVRASSPAWSALRSRLMGVVAAAVSLRTAMGAIGVTDRMARLQARVESLTGSTESAKQATDGLFDSAQALQAPFEDTVATFARMLPAVQDLGGGIEEARSLTEALMITARASGASTAESAAAALQFAQALASGRLQGDELRSIMENNAQLARLIADGLGTTIGNLREMGAQGELTAQRVSEAILSQQQRLAAMARELPNTIGGAWTRATNVITAFVAELDNASGASNVLIQGINALRIVIEEATRIMRALRDTNAETFDQEQVTTFGEVLIRVFAFVGDAATVMAQQMQRIWALMRGIVSTASAALTGDLDGARDAALRAFNDITDSFEATVNVLSGGGLTGRVSEMIERLRGSGTMSLAVDGSTAPPTGGAAGAAGSGGEAIERDTARMDLLIEQATQKWQRLDELQRKWSDTLAQPFEAWRAGLQNGLAQLFQSVATGSLRMRDVLRTAFMGILDITTGVLSQLAAEWIINSVIGQAVTIKSAFAKIKAYAAEAGAAAVASTAAIPVVGPAAAPAAGTAASAAALAFGSMLAIPSAAGGFDVPAGINPLTQLHEREMVLPEPLADTIRGMAGEGGAGGGLTLNMSVSAIDARSFERYLENNSSNVTRGMRTAAQRAGLLGR